MEQFLMYVNEDVCTDKDKKECLITGDIISIQDGIELECKHFFKYKALMKEIEMNKGKKPEIKCPYCRTLFKGVLPYREGHSKEHNVNYPLKYCLYKNKCSRVMVRGKNKGKTCGRPCEFDRCMKCCNVVKKRCSHFIKDKQCKLYVKTGDVCHHHAKNITDKS